MNVLSIVANDIIKTVTMEKQIYDVCVRLRIGEITANDATDELLALFGVVGRSEQLNCDHEWKVESFDCYGMPYEQYCKHCGKKEAI